MANTLIVVQITPKKFHEIDHLTCAVKLFIAKLISYPNELKRLSLLVTSTIFVDKVRRLTLEKYPVRGSAWVSFNL